MPSISYENIVDGFLSNIRNSRSNIIDFMTSYGKNLFISGKKTKALSNIPADTKNSRSLKIITKNVLTLQHGPIPLIPN